MKFIVSSTTLLKQLQLISGVLNNNNTLPILDNFLFEIDKGQLKVSASDLENTMRTSVPIKSENSGVICVPAKILMEYLKTLAEMPITFSINDKNFGIELSTGDGRYKIAGQDGNEFPKLPSVESTSSVEINGQILASAISKTLFATGNDDLRPVMSGVYFQLSPDDITFVATDAHKLVRYRRSDAKSTKSANFIVPKKPLNILKSACASLDENVKIEYNETNAHFAFGNTELICRLIDGKYPNYDAVIPKNNPNVLTVERGTFLNAIRRVSIFSSKTTHQVRMKMNGNELNISAEDLDFANEGNERLGAQYKGDDMEIGFNSKFLVEMLNNIGTDEVNIEMSAPNRAGILLPANNENKEEDMLMLVMPVMLNN